MAVRCPRGAEWRVWDLQVHTPFSELNNGFGTDLETYAKAFFDGAIQNNVAVVGVTDYFQAEGFRFLKTLQRDDRKLTELLGEDKLAPAKELTLLANVELRTDVLVDGSRVNYHVIFAEDVTADDITDNFLAQLHFTCEGDPDSVDQQLSLTRKNLEALGQRLKREHAQFGGMSDLFVGMMTANIDHKEVTEVLRKQDSKFGGRYVFCLPCDEDLSAISWDGQGHLIRKVLIQKSHILFSSSRSTRDFALGRKHPTPGDYLREFRTFKPCVHGSDAHTFGELFAPHEGRRTWIKADPTFQGLLQTLNEPETRVHIGSSHPHADGSAKRPTKVVTDLEVRKRPGSGLSEKWFDQRLPLNSELVAIIGNKGSGKSALADILGLLGNTPRHESFSFLSPDRFKDRKNNKAKHFEAQMSWADGKIDGPVSLDDLPADGSVENIKYIPQDYLERICNEVSLGRGSTFYAELQHVIFSHVPLEERIDFSTLDDVLEYRSSATKKAIDLHIEHLRRLNKEIVSCEDQLTEGHRKLLEAQIQAKLRELEAHDGLKPAEPAPSGDAAAAENASQATQQLQGLHSDIKNLELLIERAREQLNQTIKNRNTAERLLARVNLLRKQIDSVSEEIKGELADLGLAWADVVNVEIRTASIETAIAQAREAASEIGKQLDSDNAEGTAGRLAALRSSASAIAQQLSEPQRLREAYRIALQEWEKTRARIVGRKDVPGTLEYLKESLARLPDVQAKAEQLRRDRLKRSLEIYAEKEKLRAAYGNYYGAVQRFLTDHPLARTQQFKLTFNVAITEQGFALGFLKCLNQRRTGTFAGSQEGAERLKQLLESSDFDTRKGSAEFLLTIMRALRRDQRPGRDGASVELRDQLAQDVSVSDIYDYIFSLQYLEPVYNLRWDGKTLEQLSPGERGNLLLIFYLLIDRDDIPLVIDQPEENLDNQTVYRTLVPCVKEAKSRRQIILVTHNPNLAVVCDAEQVVCADIRKNRGNEVTYISGSLEDPVINQKVIDILEGTRPAFDKRDAKYLSQRATS